jgi:flagellar motor switch protein FliN
MADKPGLSMQAPDNERVELEPLQPQPHGTPAIPGAGLIDRVTVLLTAELGRTSVTVKDLRQIRHGQVITLDQMIGEPLGIFANGQRIGAGEVVSVAKDQYGIRITALADDVEQTRGGAP